MVEGDAKNCFDDLNGLAVDYRWSIDFFCRDAKTCSIDFIFCSFCWIRRKANYVTHSFTKFACKKLLLFLVVIRPIFLPLQVRHG